MKPTMMVEVHVNYPDDAEARSAARAAVERRLAAGANVHGAICSHYWWNDAVQSAGEVPVVFKTSEARVDALMAFIAAGHSYETPAIVVHRPETAHGPYVAWVERETREAAS